MKPNESIYKLQLHETTSITSGPYEYFIIRVPGGWLYQLTRLDHNVMTSTFVPFHSEFNDPRRAIPPTPAPTNGVPLKNSPSTTVYILNSHTNNPITIENGEYYFYDKSWSFKYGPFSTEQECRDELNEYAKKL